MIKTNLMRKLAFFAIPFSVGIFVAHTLFPASLWLSLGLCCTLLALVGVTQKRERRLGVVLLCLGTATGFLWSAGYDSLFRAPARALEGRSQPLTAVVEDWPKPTRFGISVLIRIRVEGRPDVRAVLYAPPEQATLLPGDTLSVTAECRPSDLLGGEWSDSYPAKGIFLFAYVKGTLTSTRPDRVPPNLWPVMWARSLKESIAVHFPADMALLVQAVVTGDRSGLTDTLATSLQRTGFSHAVAVSGLHISFLAGLAAQLFGSRKKRAAVVTIPVLLVFMLAAGCTPSVIRAVVMEILLLSAPLLGRETDVVTGLSLALFLLLALNPYAVNSVGLQLSFSAVAGIAAFSGRILHWLNGLWKAPPAKTPLLKFWRGGIRFVAASLATTLGAMAFTVPLGAYYFNGVSLIAPFANLLALWAVSFVFMGGLLAAVLGMVLPSLGGLLALAVTPMCQYLLWLIPLLAKLPFVAITMGSVYYLAWLVFVYVLLLLFLAWRGPRRPIVPICCCVIVLCAAVMLTLLTDATASLTMTVLNVGQGQSVLLRAGDRTALVDCGGDARDNTGDLVADYLGDRGRDRLDLLVLTHFHDDHAGGVPELMARLKVSVLAVPDVDEENPYRQEILELARAQGTEIVFIRDDMKLVLGTAKLTLYPPMGSGGANEEGLSLLCTTGDFHALITGDMNAAVESRLIKYGELPQVDLLVAGHHGSAYATSPVLLETIRPVTALISCGYDNSYGHPAPETILRLNEIGADIYRTDRQGNITVTVR